MDETFLALQRALAGEYSLEREIGRGGMGIVYLAREVQLDRLVAIKVLPAELAARDDIRERFTREARTAASLSHPNIVPIHRVGEAAGLPYFVMTYVHGETLGERLRGRGPMTATAITRVLHDVALALGYAHGRGIVHRDVKPDNILLEEGSERALVTDFGIAHLHGDDASQGAVLGTVQFMSPEQARGEAIDGRSDIFSLGVVAFIAASGKLPHDSQSVSGTLARIATTPAPKVSSVASGLPGAIARIIDRCLMFEPAQRFRTAEEIASALDTGATPPRSALPEVIRQWTSSPAPLLPVYGFWSFGWTIAAATQLAEAFRVGTSSGLQNLKIENFTVGLALALAPLVPIVIYQLRKTHRALAAGYELADLRNALRAWVRERRTELEQVSDPWWATGLRGMIYFAAIVVPVSVVIMEYRVWTPVRAPVREAVLATALVGIICLTTLSALGAPLIEPMVERRFAGKLRSWLWNSRLGGWLAKRLTPAKRGVPETQFRPTELALQLAVGDLYAALPQAYREMIGDLPPIAARLSEQVAGLRREVEQLEVLRSNARPAEEAVVDDLLGSSRRQLGQAVGALERMRLELLRLQGGASDLRALTTSLDLARAMVDDIVRIRAAEREVDPGRRALPIDVRTPSPA
jgi:serine/threonine protein kinase